MLRWQKPQSGTSDAMDEHNQPTEPMSQYPDPSLPTLPGPGSPSQADIVPAPQQQEQPFPQQYVGNVVPPQPYQPQYVPISPTRAPLFGRRKGRDQLRQPGVPIAPIAPVPMQPLPAPIG